MLIHKLFSIWKFINEISNYQMEKLISEIKMENKYIRTITKEHLKIGMGYTIKGMKSITTKYGKEIVIIICFKCKMFDLFVTKRF